MACSRLVRATALVGFLVAGCSPAAVVGTMPKVPLPPMRSEPVPDLSPPGLPYVVVADLASAEREVRFARNRDRGLLATRSGGRWLVGPVRLDRTDASAVAPTGEAGGMRPVAAATENTPAALHRHGDGFLLVWVERAVGGSDRILALALDAEGQPRGTPRTIAESAQALDWVDVLSEGGPTFILWDAQRGANRRVEAVAWLPDGVTPPVTFEGGRGWHAVASPDGLWMASASEGTGRGGTVALDRVVVAEGQLVVQHRAVSSSPTAIGDVQMAAVKGGALLAWSDSEAGELHVKVAAATADGAVGTPRSIDRMGGQALVGLTASGDGTRALVAWERERTAGGADRVVQLATLLPDGTLTDARGEASFLSATDTPPMFPDGEGFGVLTLAPMKALDAPPDSSAPTAPTFVRLGPDLRVRASEPLRAGAFAAATPVPGLPLFVQTSECADGRCTAVARGEGSPSPLAVVSVPLREPVWAPAARAIPAIDPPVAEALDTLVDLDRPAAEFEAVELGDGRTLLAWIETPVDAVNGGARLLVRVVESNGTAGEPIVISDKATPVGGLALAVLPAGSDGAAVIGWVGLTPGPQMFVARLNARGEKVSQRLVTMYSRGAGKKRKGPSDMRDVAIARDSTGGFLCSWSDSRDGALHVFVARLDGRLDRQSSDLRLTSGKGDATESRLVVLGDRALVAWSEAATEGASADVHVGTLETATLKVLDRGRALVRSAGHSHSPAFVATTDGAALAWVEEGPHAPVAENPGGNGTEGSTLDDLPGLRFVAVDGGAQALTQVKRIPIEGDGTTAIALRCGEEGCRALALARVGNAQRLDAIATGPRTPGSPTRRSLTPLFGGAEHPARLVLSVDGRRAYVAHEREGRGVVRRMQLRWSR